MRLMRLKKVIVFILVFAAVYGFVAVDDAYSNMMDQPGQVALHVRRVNTEYVTVSMFGQSKAINTKKIHEEWTNFSKEVTSRLDVAVLEIRDFLGMVEMERDYSVFKTDIL